MPGSVKTNSDRLLVLRQKGHKEDECWKKQADSGRVKAQEVESDIELRHKQFAHINFPKLQDMQSKQVVFGLQNSVAKKVELVKHANLKSNTDTRSRKSRT